MDNKPEDRCNNCRFLRKHHDQFELCTEERHNVLCQCGWGRLNVPETEIPEFCPVCGSYLCQDDGDEQYDDSMDGDAASALASCGMGTDEDYGCYDGGLEDF